MYSRIALLFGVICWSASTGWAASFFDTNRVVSIEIKLPPEDWNVLRYQHREAEFFPEEGQPKQMSAYTWFDAEVIIDGESVGKGQVRKKGYIGSNDSRRPSLKLRLGNAKKGSADRLEAALNNNLQDPSLIRQFVSYEVFRRAGVPAPRCSFAAVTVNGKALGIYSCVEPINAAFLRRNFGRADGNLYEGGRSDFRPDWFENFEIKNNEAKNDRSDLKAATDAVTKAIESGAEGSLLEVVKRHFDFDEFFRFWATESLVNQIDGYGGNMNNFYLYRNHANDRFVFIPWGADSTLLFGRALNGVSGDPRSVIATSIVPNHLYRSSEGAKLYRATLSRLLDEVWKEDELLRAVDRIEKQLMPFASKERGGFQQSVSQVRAFIKGRRAELMSELKGPAPELKSRPLPLAKRRKVGHFTARFSTVVSSPATELNGSTESSSLSGALWDRELTFRVVSVQAFVPPAGSEELARIGISGVTRADGREYFLQLGIDPDSYRAGTAIPIDNTHIRGVFGGSHGRAGGRYIGMLRGTLLLSKAPRNSGEPIEGQLNVDVFSKLPKPAE